MQGGQPYGGKLSEVISLINRKRNVKCSLAKVTRFFC